MSLQALSDIFEAKGANLISHYLDTATGGTTGDGYVLPTNGASHVSLLCIAKMTTDSTLVLTAMYADDASGTGKTDIPVSIAIYKDGVKETAIAKGSAQAITLPAAVANLVVVFEVPLAAIPEGKYVGISFANAHTNVKLTTLAITKPYYRG
jgi:hypothetical protein